MSGLSLSKFEWGGEGEQGLGSLGEERREEQDQVQRMEAEGPETDGVIITHVPGGMGDLFPGEACLGCRGHR